VDECRFRQGERRVSGRVWAWAAGFGWFIDRFGTKLGYAVSITAWSAVAMAHALVGSFSGFVSVRIALGLVKG